MLALITAAKCAHLYAFGLRWFVSSIQFGLQLIVKATQTDIVIARPQQL